MNILYMFVCITVIGHWNSWNTFRADWWTDIVTPWAPVRVNDISLLTCDWAPPTAVIVLTVGCLCNQPVFRSHDIFWPIRGQCSDHMIGFDQSEAIVQATWSVLTNQNPSLPGHSSPHWALLSLSPSHNCPWSRPLITYWSKYKWSHWSIE